MLIVTGGAGFIGHHLVQALNARGRDDLWVVDLPGAPGEAALAGARFQRLMGPDELLARLSDPSLCGVDGILHQGACTDTLERDPRRMMEANFVLPVRLLEYALRRRVPLVYASSAAVYGASTVCAERPEHERPLNLYGVSKLAFDLHVRTLLTGVTSTVIGLRYFNVYGPGEAHKGHMASMVHQAREQLLRDGRIRLFGASHGLEAGEQRRDFVWVGDVVEVVLRFLEGSPRRGIFNVGTGTSRSFNELARAVCAIEGGGDITHVPFPEALLACYQARTEADLTALRGAGIDHRFCSIEEGLRRSFCA